MGFARIAGVHSTVWIFAISAALISLAFSKMCSLLQLGYSKAYNASNPFPFMDRIGLEGKDNFFEKRVSTYGKSKVGKEKETMVFDLKTDF